MCYKVVIAEDFKMIRDVFENTVASVEGYEVTASFATAAEAAAYCRTHRVDLVMMDVLFPGGMSGMTASEQIKAVSPDTKILIVTSMPELTYISRAKEIGVESFWYKGVQDRPLLEVIRRTMAGESVYPASQSAVSLGNALGTDLTEREIQVLHELVSGASNREIGETLGIAEKTVKMHIGNMLQKTGFHSRLELAVQARHRGIAIHD
ncbi:MAG: response regulator transcription factor [Clostridia bacterium]|nr:response regulator transcription factor [Clostridia bacterium]